MDERDRVIDTLAQLHPALELAASGAPERFTPVLTARYTNAVSELHCQARLLGPTGCKPLDLAALAEAFGAANAGLRGRRLAVEEAKALRAALAGAIARLREAHTA